MEMEVEWKWQKVRWKWMALNSHHSLQKRLRMPLMQRAMHDFVQMTGYCYKAGTMYTISPVLPQKVG